MPPDNTPPVVIITGIQYNTTAGFVTLIGTASDDVGVTSVDWENTTTTDSGNCVWLDPNWTATNVPVQAGNNTIVITAYDAAANSGTDTLIVNHTACPAAGGTTVVKKIIWLGD